MLNPETLLEHQSSVTNVGNSRHFSEINVTQPNTGFPAVPMNTDPSLGKGEVCVVVILVFIVQQHINRMNYLHFV